MHVLEGCICRADSDRARKRTCSRARPTSTATGCGSAPMRLSTWPGLTRPTGNRVAWVTVLASYATAGSETVTDIDGTQHTLFINDGIIISLSRGTDASQSAAVKPTIPAGSIALCDILLDRTTAVGSLDGDQSRRPKCPPDELREEDGPAMGRDPRVYRRRSRRRLQAPDKGPTPSATSTDSLQVDATWAAGTDARPAPRPSTNPSFAGGRRARTGPTAERPPWEMCRNTASTCLTPTATSKCRVQYGNENGFGEWSNTGTIDAGRHRQILRRW